jgi:signal transduction protein with GAF and PtsI domain
MPIEILLRVPDTAQGCRKMSSNVADLLSSRDYDEDEKTQLRVLALLLASLFAITQRSRRKLLTPTATRVLNEMAKKFPELITVLADVGEMEH